MNDNVRTFPTSLIPQKTLNMMHLLARECAELNRLGLSPASAVMHARLTKCEAFLTHCFPTMPTAVRLELMEGRANLILDRYNDWVIVRPEQAAGVVTP
jgi:hypothetical protein